MTEAKRMPRCLGCFEEDDPQCDGNPVGKTPGERAPCVYRDRCAGLIKLIELTGRPRDYFIRAVEVTEGKKPVQYTFANQDDFEEQVNEQILVWGIQAGRPMNSKPLKAKRPAKVSQVRKPVKLAQKPSKAFAVAGAKARSKQTEFGREKSKELGQWYTKQAARRLSRKIAAFEEAARPGDLFIVDRLESSNYCALYCKGMGKKIAITSYQYKPIKGLIEVRVATPFKEFTTKCSRSELELLKPIDHTGKDGAFKVRIVDVDTERSSMIAMILGRISSAGIFALPEPNP